jgi:hypothetical protein
MALNRVTYTERRAEATEAGRPGSSLKRQLIGERRGLKPIVDVGEAP